MWKKIIAILVLGLILSTCQTTVVGARFDERLIKCQPYGINQLKCQPKTRFEHVSRSAIRQGRINPIIYLVKPGENIIAIAQEHNITVATLVKANNLKNPDHIKIGQKLVIPVKSTGSSQDAPVPASIKLPVLAMNWPVQGRISSHFGIRKTTPHHGVDIAAAHGALIRAPQGGRVIFAGYYGSFGNTIIIEHGANVRTLYAHCSILLVETGQIVSEKDPIARVGNTGRSFGPHLHWEVHYRGVPYDPVLCIKANELA